MKMPISGKESDVKQAKMTDQYRIFDNSALTDPDLHQTGAVTYSHWIGRTVANAGVIRKEENA